MDYNIIINQDKNENFFDFIKMRIKEYNDNISPYHKEYRKPGEVKHINIIVEDNNKEWIGGLVAETYWGWLNIQYLWVHNDYRKKSIGSILLKKAETVAVQQGCHRAQLNTYKFQAKAFYEKHGYTVVGKLENYPPGSIYYWMSKIMDLR